MKVSESSFTVYINIIKDNACSKAGIVVNELWETFTSSIAFVEGNYFFVKQPWFLGIILPWCAVYLLLKI